MEWENIQKSENLKAYIQADRQWVDMEYKQEISTPIFYREKLAWVRKAYSWLLTRLPLSYPPYLVANLKKRIRSVVFEIIKFFGKFPLWTCSIHVK